MTRAMLPQVLDLEKQSFSSLWSEAEFLGRLRQRDIVGMVTQDANHRVTGYVVYELGEDHVRVLNFAAEPGPNQAMVERSLLDKLRSKLGDKSKRLKIELAWDAEATRKRLEEHGFTLTGKHFLNWYGPQAHAIEMAIDVIPDGSGSPTVK